MRSAGFGIPQNSTNPYKTIGKPMEKLMLHWFRTPTKYHNPVKHREPMKSSGFARDLGHPKGAKVHINAGFPHPDQLQ